MTARTRATQERASITTAVTEMLDGVEYVTIPPGGPSVPERADTFRRLLAAHDEANRVAAEAACARAEAAARGRQLLAAAQERATRLLAEARADADGLRGAAAREFAALRDETPVRAREVLARAAAAAEQQRRDAREDADRVGAQTAAWLAEQQQSAVILGRQCREDARVEAVAIVGRALETATHRAAQERDQAVATAVAATLAETGALLTDAGHALSVILARIERTAASANRLDTGAGLALAGLQEAQQALTGLLPAPQVRPVTPAGRSASHSR